MRLLPITLVLPQRFFLFLFFIFVKNAAAIPRALAVSFDDRANIKLNCK
jgi:hypothetical protein